MLNLPTLRQLQYLMALHDMKNFGRAAAQCHVTQPTLSQAIIEMENLLGMKVLDRTKRKTVTFTSFGLEVIETAKKIMPDLEAMMETAKQMQEPLSGIMRLGIIPTIAPYLLPKLLPILQKNFPKMSFQITEDMSHLLIEGLENNKIDIALMALPFDTKNFQSTAIFEEKFYCASLSGTFPKNKKLKTQDLDSHNLLLLQDGHCLRDHILSACKKVTSAAEQPLKATSLHTLLQMVAQGYGMTLLPEMVIHHGIIPKNVDIHPFGTPAPSRSIGLVWQDKAYKRANIDAVVKVFKAIL